jgi:cell division GTPase FtsZ
MNRITRNQRGIEPITNALAVNTDIADLSGLSNIQSDHGHRILIGGKTTGGHGVGKINEVGASLAREHGDKVLESVNATKNLYDTDAFLVIGGAAGGTGSGSVPIVTQFLKDRYPDKPVYNLLALPFSYEEATEARCVYNVGTCLKSSYLVADAVFLVDNQRFAERSTTIQNNLSRINYHVVKPFHDLLCAGEETNPKFIGSRVLDAGDIVQTLSGWTAIGYGEVRAPKIKLQSEKRLHFREKVSKTQKGVEAMEQALTRLSIKCNARDSRRALYLLTTAPEQMNLELIKEISGSLRGMAEEAVIRMGDYPKRRASLGVTVVLSDLANSRKVMEYFTRTVEYVRFGRRRGSAAGLDYKAIGEAFNEIPSLL